MPHGDSNNNSTPGRNVNTHPTQGNKAMPDHKEDTTTTPTIHDPGTESATQDYPTELQNPLTYDVQKVNGHSVSQTRIGRPPIEIDPDEVERCAALGMTVDQIAEGLGISTRTFHNHRGTNKAVLAAYKRGIYRYRTTLLEQINANNAKGNIATQIFTAKQRHILGWSDQQEITHSGGVTFNIVAGVGKDEPDTIDITPRDDDGTETDV